MYRGYSAAVHEVLVVPKEAIWFRAPVGLCSKFAAHFVSAYASIQVIHLSSVIESARLWPGC